MATNPSNWLLITSRGNWQKLSERGSWVFSEKARKKADRVSRGDLAFVYVTKEPEQEKPGAIVACLELSGQLEESPKAGTLNSLYPYSMEFETSIIPDAPVDFESMVPNLEFIENKSNWGSHLQGQPLKEIPSEDARRMKKALEGD